MNEGKKLLYTIIADVLDKLSSLDESPLFCDDINLPELYIKICNNEDNFYQVTDAVIDHIIASAAIKNSASFKQNAKKARDLLIGKKYYNLKVNLKDEERAAIRTFVKNLGKIINDIDQDIIHKKSRIESIQNLKKRIDNHQIITNFPLIEYVTLSYDELNYDKNMLIVIKFINEFNLNLMNIKKKNAPAFDIQMIKRPKLDLEIKEIIDKLEINIKDIPNYLISEIKNCNKQDFLDTYYTIRKNKAENGGILHFIDKDNKFIKLLILLYATKDSIKGVIESVSHDNYIDISVLKKIITYIPNVLLCKNNAYYRPRYQDYIKNINYLKSLNIKYPVLMERTPLFLLSNPEILSYTLDYMSNLGADKKDIINRCYKTLSLTPSLLIENTEVMIKHNISLKDFFAPSNVNYNLLKMRDLDKKLTYIENQSEFKGKTLTCEILNKIIISKVYREAMTGGVNWEDNQ